MTTAATDLIWIPLSVAGESPDLTQLDPEPFPPRDVEPFDRLTRSIQEVGVLAPILVREQGGRFQVVCGYRRLLAARAAGLERIPALVQDLDDAEAIRCYHEDSLFHVSASRIEADAVGLRRDVFDPLDQLPLPGRSELKSPQGLSSRAGLIDLTSGDGEGQSTASSAQDESASERVLVRAAAFFDEVRVARSLNVPRTEILVDSVLELLDGGAPIRIAGFSRSAAGDYTAPHSVLVTQLCAHVAKFLGWDEEKSRNLILGGFLHDVGMTFVRETASRAAGSLSQAEVRTIQSHTRIGCAIIAGAEEWSADVADMARDHHERWNGTGYPEGKRGTAIPFLARLLGLLDTYAALITPRPHRPRLDEAYARERLLGALERGLWDPSLQPILTEALCHVKLLGADSGGIPAAHALTRNSVELRGDLATMLAKGST